MGAAGPNHIVTFNNDGFSVFGKDGTLISSTSPSAFWTNALGAIRAVSLIRGFFTIRRASAGLRSWLPPIRAPTIRFCLRV